MTRAAIAVAVAFVVSVVAAYGAEREEASVVVPIPVQISLDGELKTVTGAPRSGPTRVLISLYARKESPTPLWSEEQIVTPDAEGRYELSVGARTDGGVPAELFASASARWIGIAAEGELEEPRIRIVTVPYAARAADAQTIGGRSIEEFLGSDALRERVESIMADAIEGERAERRAAATPYAIPNAPALTARPPLSLQPVTHDAASTPAGLFEHRLATGTTTGVLGRAYSSTDGAFDDISVAVSGVRGEIVSTTAGLFSAGVRGLNFSTAAGGMGVIGYHAGPGWGVLGYSASSHGVAGGTGAASGSSAGVRAYYAGSGTGTALEINNGAIKVSGTIRPVFVHTALAATLVFDSGAGANVATRINHPLTNNDPSAIVFAVPRVDASDSVSYNDGVVPVYNASANQWWLWRQTGSIPAGAKFNVLVIKVP